MAANRKPKSKKSKAGVKHGKLVVPFTGSVVLDAYEATKIMTSVIEQWGPTARSMAVPADVAEIYATLQQYELEHEAAELVPDDARLRLFQARCTGLTTVNALTSLHEFFEGEDEVARYGKTAHKSPVLAELVALAPLFRPLVDAAVTDEREFDDAQHQDELARAVRLLRAESYVVLAPGETAAPEPEPATETVDETARLVKRLHNADTWTTVARALAIKHGRRAPAIFVNSSADKGVHKTKLWCLGTRKVAEALAAEATELGAVSTQVLPPRSHPRSFSVAVFWPWAQTGVRGSERAARTLMQRAASRLAAELDAGAQ